MEQEYIDEFFDTGRLRLSTFKAFGEHKDEQRHDPSEGVNFVVARSDTGTLAAVTLHGHNSLIFCTSTRGDDELMRDFKSDGYFKIKDTTNFGATIANRIAGFCDGLEGFCIYEDKRTILKDVEPFKIEDFRAREGGEALSAEKMSSKIFGVGGADVFFLKLKKYSAQNEYRFIWNVTSKVEKALFVDCLEAVQFCEKVT